MIVSLPKVLLFLTLSLVLLAMPTSAKAVSIQNLSSESSYWCNTKVSIPIDGLDPDFRYQVRMEQISTRSCRTGTDTSGSWTNNGKIVSPTGSTIWNYNFGEYGTFRASIWQEGKEVSSACFEIASQGQLKNVEKGCGTRVNSSPSNPTTPTPTPRVVYVYPTTSTNRPSDTVLSDIQKAFDEFLRRYYPNLVSDVRVYRN
ncbi:hypothetical protein KBD71_04125 [Candidatus Woesebacteria bacterium]|nr:hypothetical protein [Candidatus Woesebacteria bacterium]